MRRGVGGRVEVPMLDTLSEPIKARAPGTASRGVQHRRLHSQNADIIQRHTALGDVNRSYDVPVAVSNELVEYVNVLTIEQLAAASGMSVRNIRSHQARGLLAPPEVRLRVAYYGSEHVAQLRLIRDLQEEGFNLNGIKRLLDDTRGTAERLLRCKETLTAPMPGERPETLSLAELGERFQVSVEEAPDVTAKAQKLGVLVPVGNDQYEVPSRRCWRWPRRSSAGASRWAARWPSWRRSRSTVMRFRGRS